MSTVEVTTHHHRLTTRTTTQPLSEHNSSNAVNVTTIRCALTKQWQLPQWHQWHEQCRWQLHSYPQILLRQQLLPAGNANDCCVTVWKR